MSHGLILWTKEEAIVAKHPRFDIHLLMNGLPQMVDGRV